jgi:hypothetical protein
MEVMFRGRRVGEIIGDVYVSHRNTREHYFIKGKGYPISTDVLKFLSSQNIRLIRIIELGAKGTHIYETSLLNYVQAPTFKEGDFEEQRCYPLKSMTMVN